MRFAARGPVVVVVVGGKCGWSHFSAQDTVSLLSILGCAEWTAASPDTQDICIQ